jgi:hypothetical protein
MYEKSSLKEGIHYKIDIDCNTLFLLGAVSYGIMTRKSFHFYQNSQTKEI